MSMPLATSLLVMAALISCASTDSDGIPKALIGYRVFLYDKTKAPNADFLAGTIPCNYSNREAGLLQARELARSTAEKRTFDTTTDRYYIICRVTKESECTNKIR